MNTFPPNETEQHQAIRIAIFNHEGSIGKTTMTVNIAAPPAAVGKKILLVDSDPQGDLTSYLVEDLLLMTY